MYLCSVDVSQKPGRYWRELDVGKDMSICFLTVVDKDIRIRGRCPVPPFHSFYSSVVHE